MTTKTCTKCPQNGQQPLNNFAIKTGSQRSPICKACKRDYNKLHYQANKADYVSKAKIRSQEVKDWLKELKTKLCCNRCSENHPATLQFHHTDPTIKEIAISKTIRLGWNKSRILEEIEKCEILCANCHSIEHWG